LFPVVFGAWLRSKVLPINDKVNHLSVNAFSFVAKTHLILLRYFLIMIFMKKNTLPKQGVRGVNVLLRVT